MTDFFWWAFQLTSVDLLALSLILLVVVILAGLPLSDSTRLAIRRAIPRPIAAVFVIILGTFGLIVILRAALG